jgi:hypothetical protein
MNSLLSTLRVFVIFALVLGFSAIAQAATITITTNSPLPPAKLNVLYSAVLAATGGTTYTWAIVSGALPQGLSLSTTGVISGIPTTTTGSFTFSVQASSSGSTSSPKALTIDVAPVITTTSLPDGLVSSPYSQTLATVPTMGTQLTWTVSTGSLPAGLSINASTGTISGTPTTAGTSTFTVKATDNASQSSTADLSITIQPLLTVPPATLPVAVVGSSYAFQLVANGPPSPSWTLVSGPLPAGISLSASGSLSGIPATHGSFPFTVQAATTNPTQTATQSFTLVVQPPALTITTAAVLPDSPLAGQYSVSLAAVGGLQPYTWTLVGGGMPAGLTLSSAGVISGTPTSPGSFSFTAQVSDSSNQQMNRTFSITVTTTVRITTTSLPHAIQNSAYSQQLQATGTAPFFWAVISGTLPAGLTLGSGGLLQGTPTTLGSQTFTVSVTDARNATSNQQLTLTVDPPIAALSLTLPANLNPAQVVSNVTLTLAAAHASALTGQLIMTFTSTAEVPADDPATEFSSGSRTASFTIPANATTAQFSSPISLLTGTVAGTITLTAIVDNGPSSVPVASSNVLPTPPQMTNIAAIRTGAGLDVQIVGYASARRVTAATFIFDLKNGTKTSLSGNVDANFATWYKNPTSTQFGSAFSYVQSFNVTGDATQILDVTVQLTNAQGSTTSAVVKLQ